jgi:hypothetical protein
MTTPRVSNLTTGKTSTAYSVGILREAGLATEDFLCPHTLLGIKASGGFEELAQGSAVFCRDLPMPSPERRRRRTTECVLR